MFNKKLLNTVMVLALMMIAGTAFAGAKLEINDEAYIDLGYRLQAYLQNYDNDLDGVDSTRGFSLRRARFRMKGVVNDKVSIFMQTDVSGKDMQMIDAFVNYKPSHSNWLQFIMGRNMAPSSRQATTTSGALMALDRPYMVNESLTWGAGDARLTGQVPSGADRVRDNGLTIFGSGAAGNGGFKYYAGIYNGVQYEGGDGTPGNPMADDGDRFCFRAQYNFWEAESGYYNSSTYLGKKKTLGIGVSYDAQSDVGATTTATPGEMELVDYTLFSFDGFLEMPFSGGGALTVEAGWSSLDYGDAIDFNRFQGSGFYGQVGYLFGGKAALQPWILYESKTSDAAEAANGSTLGNWTNMRVGLTYFIDGQHANIKLAYESAKTETPGAAGSIEDITENTLTLGFFTNY